MLLSYAKPSFKPSSQARQDRDLAIALQSSLRPLLPVFAGIVLRHRNQHRSSPWWSRFNILRRVVRRICFAEKILTRAMAANVLARATWMAEKIVPAAYLYDYPLFA